MNFPRNPPFPTPRRGAALDPAAAAGCCLRAVARCPWRTRPCLSVPRKQSETAARKQEMYGSTVGGAPVRWLTWCAHNSNFTWVD